MVGERDGQPGGDSTVADEDADTMVAGAETTGDGDPAGPLPGWPRGWERYRPDGVLGTGGMGRVFRAHDPVLGRFVAIKLLHSTTPEMAERFAREARLQARVDHPNVCKVYEVGEVDGLPYIAMQLVTGTSLAHLAGGLSAEEKVLLVRKVADAVQAAHRVGLVHRDLKPANVMVETAEDGGLHPCVVDFGLVREIGSEGLTVSHAAVGTPSYMAPEQAADAAHADRRADVYGLGATLYTLLAGRPPFVGGTPLEVLRQVLDTEPPPLRKLAPHLPADLETIVMRCLEKDPGRRYDSARALSDDLGRYLEGDPVEARPPSIVYRVRKRARKHRALVALGAVALLATLALAGLWWQAVRTAAARAELAERFGRRVAEAESVLWKEQSLELHDIRPARARLRKELAAIEAEMSRRGRAALGPGHQALGRGYVALLDPRRARAHLEAARAAGWDTPEVAFGLGLALGELYRSELERVERLPAGALREDARARAQRDLRDPAVAALKASGGGPGVAPDLLAGLLALHEDRTDEAVTHARAAAAAVPWLYEARVLEGDAELRSSLLRRRRGDHEGARAASVQAEAAFRAAARVAESDFRPRLGVCRTLSGRLHAEVWDRSAGEESTREAGVKACGECLVVDPDSADALLHLADVHGSWADFQVSRRQDPATAIAATVSASERAIALDPADTRAPARLAGALWTRAKHELIHGVDPRPSFARAAEVLSAALKLDSQDSGLLSTLGLVEMELGSYEVQTGADAEAALLRSAAAFERAAAARPEGGIFVNLGLVHQLRLEQRLRDGRADGAEMEAVAAAALSALDRAEALKPGLHWTLTTRASIHKALLRDRVQRGEDPAEHQARAEEVLAAARAAAPGEPRTLQVLVDLRTMWCAHLANQRRCRAACLADLRSAVAEGRRVLPGWDGWDAGAERARELAPHCP